MLGGTITRVETKVYFQLSAQSADLPTNLIAYNLKRTIPSVRDRYASPSLHRNIHKYGNINPFAIGLTFRLILRTRLTLI